MTTSRGSFTTLIPANVEDEPVFKEGTLWKRGRKLTSGWKRRRFVLRPTLLTYFEMTSTGAADEERRFVDITQSTQVLPRPDKGPLVFQVRTPGFRKITARCETEDELKYWIGAIKECIENAPAFPIKCVIVGDDEPGKRRLLRRYLDRIAASDDASRPGQSPARGSSLGVKTTSASVTLQRPRAKLQQPHGATPINKDKSKVIKPSPQEELTMMDVLLETDPARGRWVKFMIWSVGGTFERFEKLRQLAYPHTDVCLIVFSTVDQASFERVETYAKELRANSHDPTRSPQVLVVGTTSGSASAGNEPGKLITPEMGVEKARKLGAFAYCECRTDEADSCEAVFAAALTSVMEANAEQTSVFATMDLQASPSSTVAPKRHGSGSNLRARFSGLLTSKASSGSEDVVPLTPSPKGSTLSKRGSGYKLLSSFFPSPKPVKASLTVAQPAGKDLASPKASPAGPPQQEEEEDDDSGDEGSLIGVEVDEAEAEQSAQRDFGFDSAQEDLSYTTRVLEKRRWARHAAPASPSNKLGATGLGGIQEAGVSEEHEMELDEMREKAMRREAELSSMRAVMSAMMRNGELVERQMMEMRREMERLQQRSGGATSPPPTPSAAAARAVSPSESSGTGSETTFSTVRDLPPLAPVKGRASDLRGKLASTKAVSALF